MSQHRCDTEQCLVRDLEFGALSVWVEEEVMTQMRATRKNSH